MKITNAFDIAAPPEVVWPVLNDVPRVARCIPNALVEESQEAGTYRVLVPIRIGFFTIKYQTTIVVARREDDTYEAELEIEGDQLGGGKVRARVLVQATRVDGGTHVDFETNAELGGFIGTVGKPVVDGVARRTVAEFAKKLETILP